MTAARRATLTDPADFTAALHEGGVDATALAVDDKGTIAAGSRSSQGPGDQSSRRRLTLATSSGDSEIVVTGSISKGGMGEVMLARQSSLHREVAVKVLKDGGSERASDLVIEARIAGNLEHPNIVPVHVLGADKDGLPMLVMKRVEGETWRTLLQSGRDLERDLHILMEVCQALHFAHSRGVAHCDVKPGNVMVGPFGEVYLVDWGVAVGFGNCTIADVPRASTLRGVFGTPKYLAPEMALPGGVIDARTDVYIVGAVLYELVTGQPLRGGRRSIEALLHEAHLSPPPAFGDDVDVELQEICRRALARTAALRFASVDELRLALVEYQRHGAARVLIAEGEGHLRSLTDLIARADDERSIRAAFLGCRFAFQAALRQWPEAERARQGLDDAIARMVRWELAREELASAQGLLGELATAPAALVAEVEVLATAHAARARATSELAQRALQQDRHVAEGERATFVFGSGVAWLVTMVGLDGLSARGLVVAGPAVFSTFMALFALVLIVAGLAIPALRRTEASRAMLITMQATVIGLATVHGIGWALGIAAATMLAIGHTLLAVTSAQLAAADGRLWLATTIAVLAVPAMVAWPAHATVTSGVVGFLMLGDIARRWRRPPAR